MASSPDASERARALGLFVRARRAKLMAPEEGGRRRRTPGLRREELAERALLSLTWVTWIEQGRSVSVSPWALDRLGRALELSPAERSYLFDLAGKRDPAAGPPAALPVPYLQAVVDGIRGPAYALDRLWNIVCSNRAADLLFGWREAECEPPNLLVFMFTSAQARSLTPDWPERARRLIAEFRADAGAALQEPDVRGLLDHLRVQSDFFREAWTEQRVVGRAGGARRFHHPEQGSLTYEQRTFRDAQRPDLKLVMLI